MKWFALLRFLFVFCNGIVAAMFQKRTVAEAPEFATGAKRMRAGLNMFFGETNYQLLKFIISLKLLMMLVSGM